MAAENQKRNVCLRFIKTGKTPLAVKVTETTFSTRILHLFLSYSMSRVSGNDSEDLSEMAKVSVMAAISVSSAS